MARALRLQIAGASYHAMSRGNARQPIVRDDNDRTERLELLKQTVQKHGWILHAFALMSNHEHLFMTTPEPNLSVGMRYLNGNYASSFNRRHKRVGHLFQGRFKGIIVDTDCYSLGLSRYIHLNPYVAGIVAKPQDYCWSSYPGYHWKARSLSWVSYELVLSEFGADQNKARRAYRRFIMAAMDEDAFDPFAEAVESLILGSDEFVERIRAMLTGLPHDAAVPQLARLRQRPTLCDITSAVGAEFGSDLSRWRYGRRIDNGARAVAAFLATECFGHSATATAAVLGYAGPSSVTHAIQRIRISQHSARNAKLERLIGRFTAGE